MTTKKLFNIKTLVKRFFLLAPLVLFYLFFPRPAQAGVLQNIFSKIAAIPTFFSVGILGIIGWITGGLAILCGAFLDWVTGPAFVNIPYTNNDFVNLGLGITKHFVNLILVVMLVYIALCIALRLKERATHITLARLVIIALLVNFAPVFCGLIIDASNIVMNYFLIGIQEGVSGILTGLGMGTIWGDMIKGLGGEFSDQISLVMKGLLVITMNLSVAFAFLLFAAIFFFRLIAIWILVILSPLAFVAWILPATKKFWDQWWQQFIQWSIIGIPLAFFLYLAMATVGPLNTMFRAKMTAPGIEQETVGLLDMMLPYIAITAILYFGFILGLQTSAMGASSITNFAQTQVKKMPGRAYKGTKIAAGWTVEKAREKLSTKRMRDWGARQATRGKWGEGETGTGGYFKRAASTVNPLRYALRGAGKVVGGGIIDTQQKRIKEAEDSVKDTDKLSTLSGRYHDAVTDTERIGIMNKIIKRGEIGDAMNEKKLGKSAIKSDEVDRIMGKAKKWESDKTLRQAFPHIGAKYIADDDEEFIKAKEKDPRITTKESFIISKMKPADYKNISEEALDINNQDPEKAKAAIAVVNAILATAMGSHVSQLIEQHGAIAAKALEDRIDAGAPVDLRLKRYLSRGAGAALISPKTPLKDWAPPSPPPPTPPTPPSGPAPSAQPSPSGRRAGGEAGPSSGTAPSGRRPGGKP